MNLVLIGYRGTGKTEIGKVLAERLGMEYMCTDNEVTKKEGRSIPEIVAAEGWSYFREKESEVADCISTRDGLVVDCGGGFVIERLENGEKLKKNSTIFLLTAEVGIIEDRIKGDTERPSLTEGDKTFIEEIEEVLTVRRPIYDSFKDHEVRTDDLTIDEVASEVEIIWKGR